MGANLVVEPLSLVEPEVVRCHCHLFGFTLWVAEVWVIIVGLSFSISEH